MESYATILNGVDAIDVLQSNASFNSCPLLNTNHFYTWISEKNIRKLQYDSEYQAKVLIRSIEQENYSAIEQVKQERKEKENIWKLQVWKNGENAMSYHDKLIKDIEGYGKAIEGMQNKLASCKVNDEDALRDRLRIKIVMKTEAESELQLLESASDYIAYKNAVLSENNLMTSLFEVPKASLASSRVILGNTRNSSGIAFENTAAEIIKVIVVLIFISKSINIYCLIIYLFIYRSIYYQNWLLNIILIYVICTYCKMPHSVWDVVERLVKLIALYITKYQVQP
jgi:hypothetical protein